MKRNFILLLISILPLMVISQNKETKFGIEFSGFVKSDFFWDSRQNVTIREGHFLLYPSPVSNDAEDNDINAKSNFNFLSIQSRLSGKISGPDAFGAKTSGVIEADFFGNENAAFVDVNGFRLRHAYAKLNWEKTELLFGQSWHPMFIAGCFPGVVSFNTGSPFMPFSRNPQAKLTYKMGKISLSVSANSQRDFTSTGGSVALRNSAVPEMHMQMIYGNKNEEKKKEILAGFGAGYKTLVPRLYSEMTDSAGTKKYKTDETVGGYAAYAFLKYKVPAVTFKLYGTYGQNLYDQVMIGGYVVTAITDPVRGLKEYQPLNTMSAWTEIMSNGKKVQAGLFAGYTQNMGISKDTILDYTANNRGGDIKNVYRVAPRIVFISEKFQLMTEIEYTTAAYATKTNGVLDRDEMGVITAAENVSNIRVLFAIMYNF